MAFDINAARNSVQGLSSNNKFPSIVYVPNGSLMVRFYIDCENQVLRTFQRHSIKIKKPDGSASTFHVRCMASSSGCPICDHIYEKFSGEPGYEPGWKWEYEKKNNTIAYGFIFKSNAEWEIKPQYISTPIVLMSGKRFASELSEMIQKLPDEEMVKVFTPELPHYLWEIKCKDFGKDSFNVSPVSWEQKSMEPLPQGAPPLSQVYYKENEMPSREVLYEFINKFDERFESGLRMLDPNKSSTPPWEKEPEKAPEKAPEPHKADTGPYTVDLSKIKASVGNAVEPSTKSKPETKGNSAPENPVKACFSKYNKDDVSCMVCNLSDSCIEETLKV
jgi:hypothetical protein